MRTRLGFLLFARALLVGGLLASVSFADGLEPSELQTLFMEANSFFEQANEASTGDAAEAKELYRKSILRYERLLQEGGIRNGRLYYNLGNAYFLSGDLGRAVLNYRRAGRLIPNDPNLHQNLTYVRGQRIDRIEEREKTKVLKTLFFWHYDLSGKVRMILFGLFFVGLWLCAGVRLFVRRSGLVWGLVICLIVSALLFGSLTVESISHASDQSGVILAEEAVARKGPGETYQPSFKETLHPGTEFSLIEDRGDWYQIELHDGRRCWVPEESAALVRQDQV
jgi:hypothetical protein